LFGILNDRYQSQHPTIVISNLPVSAAKGSESLETYLGTKGLDRLRENGGKVVVFGWESFRGRT
jgi:DNA replication protein DnaC